MRTAIMEEREISWESLGILLSLVCSLCECMCLQKNGYYGNIDS